MREQGGEVSASGAAGGVVEEGGEVINYSCQEADGWRLGGAGIWRGIEEIGSRGHNCPG